MLQFRQLLRWSEISFPEAFLLGLQTGSSRWEPDPESTVDKEVIQSAIRVILQLLLSTCDTEHCLGEGALLSSSFWVVFSQFLSSKAPIMPYNSLIFFWYVVFWEPEYTTLRPL